MSAEIIVGDCLESMRKMPDCSVHCCVTSPPYYGLRDYGHDGQIGLEESPDSYVLKMVEVFREVRRILREDGTLWLNLGDSYSRAQETNVPQTKNPECAFPVHSKEGSSDGFVGRGDKPGSRVSALPPKNLLGIPWRVALALQADGWYLRQDIIWAKPNPMPESVTDRCTKAHEYIFLLSKSAWYYFDSAAISERSIYGAKGSEFNTGKTAEHQLGRSSDKPRDARAGMGRIAYEGKRTSEPDSNNGQQSFVSITETRNKRSVWTVATQPFSEAHFATFPPLLIKPCILAGCPRDGVVLDPFGGSGTTGFVAKQLLRNSILCELNPEYAQMASRRCDFVVTEEFVFEEGATP